MLPRKVQQGYAGTTTRAVAERARVSPGALQHHFASKQELVAEAVGYLSSKLTAQLIEQGVPSASSRRQVTEQLLRGIRANRAKVVVIDITGVPTVDSTVANHLVQTVDASRLMGATVIVTGLSSEIAQTLVTIGVDLTKMKTVGDLQGGIEEAERLLGYKVILEESTKESETP